MSGKQKTTRTLALFDVDGTLTVPRQVSLVDRSKRRLFQQTSFSYRHYSFGRERTKTC